MNSLEITETILPISKESGGQLSRVIPVPSMASAHRHSQLELNLVFSGRATYVLEGFRYSLHPGCLVWLFPGQDHMLLDASPNFGYWLGVFEPTLVMEAAGIGAASLLRETNPGGEFCRYLSDHGMDRLLRLFEAGGTFTNTATRHWGLQHALLAAWDCFEEASPFPPSWAIHPSVERAVEILREGETDCSVFDLAQRVGLSAPYLSTLFKAQVGRGIAEFRNELRIEAFQRAFSRGDRSLQEAAIEAGFGSYAQFYRVYMAKTGHAPSGELMGSTGD